MKETFIAQLKSVTNLPVSAIEELWDLGRIMNIKKGELLVKPEQVVGYGYFLFNGICQYYSHGADGGEIVNTFRSGPSLIAPSSSGLFLGEKAQIHCKATTDLKGLRIDGDKIFEFADRHPQFYLFLLTILANIFREKERKEISFTQKSGMERYLDFLIDFPGLVDHVSLNAIASYLKLRPGSLSRIRKELRS